MSDKLFNGDVPGEEVRIKIVGIGGAGNNAVDRLQLDPSSSVSLAAINTDAQALESSPLQEKLMIGRGITRGLSAGGDVELAKQAAESDAAAIAKVINGRDIIFLLAGMGGGTGSGVAPVVAKMAAEQGALVIAFVTLPFTMEGAGRKENSDAAMAELRQVCDAVIPLPNDILLQHMPEDATVLDAFAQADEWINRGVKSICAMMFQTGMINLDFATLKKAFVNKGGKTLFGLGRGQGGDYVNEAINDLSLCPLLHTPEFARRADRLLVNVVGGTDLSIKEVNVVMSVLTEKFGSKENTILGAVIDDSLKQHLEICVIGTTDVGGKQFVQKKNKNRILSEPAASIPQNASEDNFNLDELELTTASATQKASKKRVHASKLKRKKETEKSLDSQEEFLFITEEEHRGYFEKTDRNVFDGEDLDVPTYLRKGIKVHL